MGPLGRRRWFSGEGQYLLGNSSVFAAEMMAFADGQARHPVRQVGADGVLVTVSVQAQHACALGVECAVVAAARQQCSELRTRRRPVRVRTDPAGDMDL